MDFRFLILGLCSLIATSALGAPLSPQGALKRISDAAPRQAKAIAADAPTFQSSFGSTEAPVYLFAYRNGDFIVAAGDDAAPVPLLGYGTNFSTVDDMPASLKWALATMGAHQTYASSAPHAELQPIEPLIKSQWNQAEPYNNLAPVIAGGRRAVTGCVATAMAQIARFWEWPKSTTGNISYSYRDCYNRTQQYSTSIDRTYDYSLMPLSDDGFTSDDQRKEVAKLMNTCGAVASMMWGLASTGGSGAYATDALHGLITHMGYTPAAHMELAEWHTPREWIDLIYGELQAGRPVFYGGAGSDGAHQFICDGYSADNFFHFNWGWSGQCDGYFLLTALNPLNQGIGGNTSGFNEEQNITVQLEPSHRAASTSAAPPVMCVYNSKFTVDRLSYERNSFSTVSFGGEYVNMSPSTITALCGIELVPEGGGASVFVGCDESPTLAGSTGIEGMRVDMADLPAEGSFSVYPAFKCDGVWRRMRWPIALTGPLSMVCSQSQIKFSSQSGQPVAPPFEADWEVTHVTGADGSAAPADNLLYRGRTYTLNFDVLGSRKENLKTQAIIYINDAERLRSAGPIMAVTDENVVSASVNVAIPADIQPGSKLGVGLRLYNSTDIDLLLQPDRSFQVAKDPAEPIEPQFLDEITDLNGGERLTLGSPFSISYDFMTDTDLGPSTVAMGIYSGSSLIKTIHSERVDVEADKLYSITASQCVVTEADIAGISDLHLGVEIAGGYSWRHIFDEQLLFASPEPLRAELTFWSMGAEGDLVELQAGQSEVAEFSVTFSRPTTASSVLSMAEGEEFTGPTTSSPATVYAWRMVYAVPQATDKEQRFTPQITITTTDGDTFTLSSPTTYFIASKSGSLSALSVDGAHPTEWYSLQGVAIPKPSCPGVYLMKHGGKTSLIVIK